MIKNSDLEALRELASRTFRTMYHRKWRGLDVTIKRFDDKCFDQKPAEETLKDIKNVVDKEIDNRGGVRVSSSLRSLA